MLLALAFGIVVPARAHVVSGFVADPAGQGVAEVDLDADDLLAGGRVPTPDDNTDADGRFSVELPAGIYRLTFQPPTGLPLAAAVLPRVEVTGDVELRIDLVAGASLAGRVTGPDAMGVATVDIDVWDRTYGIKIPTPNDDTNGLGFYSVVVPPGTYDLVFEPPVATRLVPVRLESVTVRVDTTVAVRLEQGVSFGGRVTSATGGPAAGIDLDLTDPVTGLDVPIAGDKTDADGRFQVIVRPARYDLTLDAPSATRLVSRLLPALQLLEDTERTYELEPGFEVRGTVTDTTGQVIEGVDMDFWRQPDGEAILTPADFTNPAGQFSVVLPAGLFDVIATPPAGSAWLPDTTRGVAVERDLVFDVYFGGNSAPVVEPSPGVLPVARPIFPNPAAGSATLPLALDPAGGAVRIRIIDAQGRLIRRLTRDVIGAGETAVVWNGITSAGTPASSGVYFFHVQQGNWSTTRKLLLLRHAAR